MTLERQANGGTQTSTYTTHAHHAARTQTHPAHCAHTNIAPSASHTMQRQHATQRQRAQSGSMRRSAQGGRAHDQESEAAAMRASSCSSDGGGATGIWSASSRRLRRGARRARARAQEHRRLGLSVDTVEAVQERLLPLLLGVHRAQVVVGGADVALCGTQHLGERRARCVACPGWAPPWPSYTAKKCAERRKEVRSRPSTKAPSSATI